MHLQRVAESTGKVDPLLEEIPVPNYLQAVLAAFLELVQHKASGFGEGTILHSEISAYCGNYGVELSPWEVETVMEMDRAFLQTRAKKD
jgi:hypothetical protein